MRRTIKDAARIAGVAPSTIRNWTRRGLVRVARDWRNARVFSDEDLRRLRELAGSPEASGTTRQALDAGQPDHETLDDER